MSTTLGIHSVSLENATASASRPAVVRRLDDDRPAEVRAGAAQLHRARLLGEDVERQVDAPGERRIAGDERRPVLANPAQLRCERPGRVAHRLAQPCRERQLLLRARRRVARPFDRGARGEAAGSGSPRPPSSRSVALTTASYGVWSRSGWSSTSSRTSVAAGSSFSAARTSTSASRSGPARPGAAAAAVRVASSRNWTRHALPTSARASSPSDSSTATTAAPRSARPAARSVSMSRWRTASSAASAATSPPLTAGCPVFPRVAVSRAAIRRAAPASAASRVPSRPTMGSRPCRRRAARARGIARIGRRMSDPDGFGASGDDVLDRATQDLEARWVELVRPVPDALGSMELLVEPFARAPRATSGSGPPSDRSTQGAPCRRSWPTAARRRCVPAIESVSAMFSAPRSEAQTTPTRVPSSSAAISCTSST